MSDSASEDFKTIELRTTIKAVGREFDKLDLRAPRVGERRKAEGVYSRGITPEAATRYAVTLIAQVADVSEAVIEQMDVDQFEEAFQFLQGFSERGRAIGTN